MTDVTLGTGLKLSAELLTTAPFHVPNGKGGAYKSELVLLRSKEHTHKILWWHEDDPRPEPHNHPWEFVSNILSGGYTEDRWWVDVNGELQTSSITYRVGDINNMPNNVYHVVRDVQSKTVTELKCGQMSEGGKWGYLDLSSKEYYEAPKDPEFVKHLWALNPHMAPKHNTL